MGYTVPGRVSTFWGTLEKWCLLLRVQFKPPALGATDAPNTKAEVLTVATRTWADNRARQVQVVRIVVIVRSRRPIVPVATSIVRRRTSEAAGVEEVVRIGS